MKKLISNNFTLGFLVGIILFVAFNLIFPIEKIDFGNMYNFGYPFPFYQEGYISHGENLREISWIRLIADVLIGLIFSFVLGLFLSLCGRAAFRRN